MIKSFDGGATGRGREHLHRLRHLQLFEPSIGRCVEDGVGGARSDLSPAPSVDIANGAPTRRRRDRPDRHQLGRRPRRPQPGARDVQRSTNGGASWARAGSGRAAAPTAATTRRRRSRPTAATSTRLQRVHHAVPRPARWRRQRPPARRRRPARGLTTAGVGAFTEIHRGAPTGDARGSSQNDLRQSSSATTSTRRRRTTTARPSGTTCATRRTARRSTSTARSCTRRRSPPASRPPRPRSRAARATATPATDGDAADAPDVQQRVPGQLRQLRHLRLLELVRSVSDLPAYPLRAGAEAD